jgi:hypothetical protein
MKFNLFSLFEPRKRFFLISFAGLLLSGCSGVPSDEEATFAVRSLLANGGKITGMALPSSLGISEVKVGDCADAKPLDGRYCAVKIVSEEVPIIGAIAIPITLRFSKRGDSWTAFLN